MNIVILASIGSQNLWDELILKNEINILEERYIKELHSKKSSTWKSGIAFTVFTYDIKDTFYNAENVRYKEYFPIGLKNPKNIFRNIKNFFVFIKEVIRSDLVVIWWGWIFYDSENQSVWSPLKQWLFRVNVIKLLQKKIEIFRVSIEIKKKSNLDYIKNIFSKVDTISVRDSYSFDLLKELSIKKEVSIIQDPVFSDRIVFDKEKKSGDTEDALNKGIIIDCLQSKKLNIDNLEIILDKKSVTWKTFWISLRKMNIDNYFKNILEVLKYIIDNKWSVCFVPHSFHKTDPVANDFIFLNELNLELYKIYKTEIDNQDVKISICHNIEESYWMYIDKKIDYNFAQRLHSIILSQVYEIPFIWISYSKKTDEVLKQIQEKKI